MPAFSIIVPVYNRPDEVDEFLDSLTKQYFKDFEVLIIDDGSTLDCKSICDKYNTKLAIRYFSKPNTGQGFTRNMGFELATGDFFVQLDSDVIVPPDYFLNVKNGIERDNLDCYGGPDQAHENFTPIQKAVNYAMTSFFTTGGIRGKKQNLGGQFHPRSFNFGLSREVWQKVGGYKITRMGEDIEFSIRIIKAGFKTGLIQEAFIYHKRRTSFQQFFKQLHFFGRARINIARFYPEELKAVHYFPLLFLLFCVFIPIEYFVLKPLAFLSIVLLLVYFVLIFIHASVVNRQLKVGLLSIPACFIQLFAYGLGFASEKLKKRTIH